MPERQILSMSESSPQSFNFSADFSNDAIASKMAQAEADVQLYVAAVQNMQVGLHIWQLEEKEDGSDCLRLVATNPAAHASTGIPETAAIVGKTMAEVFPATVETDIPATYAQIARSGQGRD